MALQFEWRSFIYLQQKSGVKVFSFSGFKKEYFVTFDKRCGNMNFIIAQDINFTVIQSSVEKLDASNAPDLKSELLLLNKNGVNSIILDLSRTRYCDSSGLSAILTANRLCKDTNGQFILCGLQENVAKMIRIAQLDKVLSISETLEEAKSVLI